MHFQVSIIPTKAEAIKGSSKFRCPIPSCRYHRKEGSRVYISKHFNREHTDHRSWRDVFVKVDAPSIISVAQGCYSTDNYFIPRICHRTRPQSCLKSCSEA